MFKFNKNDNDKSIKDNPIVFKPVNDQPDSSWETVYKWIAEEKTPSGKSILISPYQGNRWKLGQTYADNKIGIYAYYRSSIDTLFIRDNFGLYQGKAIPMPNDPETFSKIQLTKKVDPAKLTLNNCNILDEFVRETSNIYLNSDLTWNISYNIDSNEWIKNKLKQLLANYPLDILLVTPISKNSEPRNWDAELALYLVKITYSYDELKELYSKQPWVADYLFYSHCFLGNKRNDGPETYVAPKEKESVSPLTYLKTKLTLAIYTNQSSSDIIKIVKGIRELKNVN